MLSFAGVFCIRSETSPLTRSLSLSTPSVYVAASFSSCRFLRLHRLAFSSPICFPHSSFASLFASPHYVPRPDLSHSSLACSPAPCVSFSVQIRHSSAKQL